MQPAEVYNRSVGGALAWALQGTCKKHMFNQCIINTCLCIFMSLPRLEQLEIGQIREGVVRKIQDFGAFVDIGGVDGLIIL